MRHAVFTYDVVRELYPIRGIGLVWFKCYTEVC